MGAHSTLDVTRAAAIEKLQEVDWTQQTNERFERVLYCLFDESLYNFNVFDEIIQRFSLSGEYDRPDDSNVLRGLYIDPIRESSSEEEAVARLKALGYSVTKE